MQKASTTQFDEDNEMSFRFLGKIHKCLRENRQKFKIETEQVKQQNRSVLGIRNLNEERLERKLRNKSSTERPLTALQISPITSEQYFRDKEQNISSSKIGFINSVQKETNRKLLMRLHRNNDDIIQVQSQEYNLQEQYPQSQNKSFFTLKNMIQFQRSRTNLHFSVIDRSIPKERKEKVEEKIKNEYPIFSKSTKDQIEKINQLENQWSIFKEKSLNRSSSVTRSLNASKSIQPVNSSLILKASGTGLLRFFKQSPQPSPKNTVDELITIDNRMSDNLDDKNSNNQDDLSYKIQQANQYFRNKSPLIQSWQYDTALTQERRQHSPLLRSSFFTNYNQTNLTNLERIKLQYSHRQNKENKRNISKLKVTQNKELRGKNIGYLPFGPTNPLLLSQQQRAYHSMEGSKKKKAIDQSLMELKKKYNIPNEKKNVSDEEDNSTTKRKSDGNLSNVQVSKVIRDNVNNLMQQVTNLYVGNLSPDVTESMLTKVFCKFGEIESVKVMWPRTEEERKRKRNCGFVKFYKYESAYLAKEFLNEQLLCGNGMRLNWGKGISTQIRNAGLMVDFQGIVGDPDVEMCFIENQLNMIIHSLNLPSDGEILEQEFKFFPPGIPFIQVKIPKDTIERYQIDKLAKFVAEEGFGFEEEMKRIILKGKEIQNETLRKLFIHEDKDLLQYYQWRVYSFFNGDSTHSWSQHLFQMYQEGPVWVPPRNLQDSLRLNPAKIIQDKVTKQLKIGSINQDQESLTMVDEDETVQRIRNEREQQIQGYQPLKASERHMIEEFIRNTVNTKRSVCERMILAMEYAQSAREVQEIIYKEILDQCNKDQIDQKKIFAYLFLISDILFNSQNPQIPASWTYRKEFETKLSNIFEQLNNIWLNKIEGKLSQKQLKKGALRLLKIWKDASIYEDRVLDGWEATLKIDKINFYSFNLIDSEFIPQGISNQKLIDKMKQIVVPELKRCYKKLQDNQRQDPNIIDRECKLSGIPLHSKDKLERLVAIQEYQVRKIVKQKLNQEQRMEDNEQSKDLFMTKILHQNIRKPLTYFNDQINLEQILTPEERKLIIEKAIQDLAQDIAKLRNFQLKIQQSYLQLDQKDIEGIPISEQDYHLFDLNQRISQRNLRIIAITEKALQKGKGEIDLDNLSLDSDELITTQEDVEDHEDIDGVELSDSDEIFYKNTQNEDQFSALITSDHLKKILKYARQKRVLQEKRHKLKSQTSGCRHIDGELLTLSEQLDTLRFQYSRSFEKLDEKEVAFHRLKRLKKRYDDDLDHFAKDLGQKYSEKDKQLKILKEKIRMYRQLIERMKQEEIESKTKSIYKQTSIEQKVKDGIKKKRSNSSSSSSSQSSSSLENSSNDDSRSKHDRDRARSKDSRQEFRQRNIERKQESRSYQSKEYQNQQSSERERGYFDRGQHSKWDNRGYQRRSRSREKDIHHFRNEQFEADLGVYQPIQSKPLQVQDVLKQVKSIQEKKSIFDRITLPQQNYNLDEEYELMKQSQRESGRFSQRGGFRDRGGFEGRGSHRGGSRFN